ncbi:MAG: zf-HC2 domain-containing protein [bacterium]|nr:zf-HC2 domain-containing protein [bacterium]
MNDKKYPCGLVQDLLPLYRDNVCGAESRRIVEEHLAECGACKKLSEQMADNGVERLLMQEADGVLEHHQKKEKRTAMMAGIVTAGILMIPVIVCFICNLATGHALDWFFIVLTALLVVASLTVVPMLANRYRFSKTVISFTGSLLLLLLTCCIYARGRWFLLAAVPVVFGLSVLFLPFILMQVPLPEPLRRQKGLAVMLWDTLWLYGIIIVCGLHGGGVSYWHNALLITSWCLLLPWGIFLTARYAKCRPVTKAGILVMIVGCFISTVNDMIAYFLLPKEPPYSPSALHANLMDWTNPRQVGDNVCLMTLIGSIVIGVVCIAAEIAHRKRK